MQFPEYILLTVTSGTRTGIGMVLEMPHSAPYQPQGNPERQFLPAPRGP